MVLFKRYLQDLGLLLNSELITLPPVESFKCNQQETIQNLALAFKTYMKSMLDDNSVFLNFTSKFIEKEA